ncbi:uncharacterized protein [Watersipora subatra]|uniref:uncharacterized protein n=1 Tax=Watersipora subatra TaxID=2589382 RepID=UPI00355C6685
MLKMIQRKRDEQNSNYNISPTSSGEKLAEINSLKEQYDEIEKKVLENRQKSKVHITDFLEDVVLDKWRSLRNHREMLETKIKHSPPDDIVRGFKAMKKQMDNFIVEELPKLEVGEQLQVRQTGEKREIELKIVSAEDIVVNNNQHPVVLQQPQLPLFQPPPKSITLLKSIKLPSEPISVCQHEGVTYVGLYNGTVSRIDSNYTLHNSIISTSGRVESISLHVNRLYILSRSEPCTTLRNISCPLLSNNMVSICAGYGDDVIITDCKTKKVFRFNITTGNVMWTFTHPYHLLGLVCYGDYILVAAFNSSIIYTLNYTTGRKVSEMRGAGIGHGSICSLSVNGNTLVAPQWHTNNVFFYKLSEK